jgi:hypothetical protein
MKKETLISMIKIAYNNNKLLSILNLYCEIDIDKSLPETLTIDSFNEKFYSPTEMRYIKQCFDFKIT